MLASDGLGGPALVVLVDVVLLLRLVVEVEGLADVVVVGGCVLVGGFVAVLLEDDVVVEEGGIGLPQDPKSERQPVSQYSGPFPHQ